MSDAHPGDPSDAELERALELDRLAQRFRSELARDPSLTAEAYAARCQEEGQAGGHGITAEELLPVLRGMGALTRVSQRAEGPFADGERVGPYEIRGVLGRGGMGVVYEAVEEDLGRAVAVKAMHAAADDRFRERFAREARAAARLDHPSIVPVYGSGEHDGVLWYAMRQVQGVALDRLLDDLGGGDGEARRAALTQLGAAAAGSSVSSSGSGMLAERERAAVTIALRLADALAYAHAEGVLHRDVKPANVLLDRDGGALLTDFGLCKVDGDASLTRDTDIVGTLRYMPPESMAGQTDGRGDVYGVGLVLLEILAGRPAFDVGDRRGLIQDILHRDPEPLREGSFPLSGDLEKVVRKAIAKLPEERYATASDLGDDLRALLAGQPVRARATTSPLYLLRLFVRRNRALSATVAAATLALAVGAALYIDQLRSANVKVSAARDLAEARAAEASVATAEATLRVGDTSGAAGALEAVAPEHRGWMWRHLSDRVGVRTPRIGLGTSEPTAFSVSPDGGRALVLTRERLQLLEWKGEGDPSAVHELERTAIDVRFDPDGRAGFIDRRTRRLVRWTPGEEKPLEELASLPRRAKALRFSPDGSVALVLDGNTRLVAIDLATGEEAWSRTIPVNRIDSLEALSATAFVIGSTGGEVVVGEAGEGQLRVAAQHFGRVRDLLVGSGSLLASGGEAGQLDLEPALTGHTRVRVRIGQPVLAITRVRGDGRLIAVATGAESIALVDVSTGSITRWLTGPRAQPVGLWSAPARTGEGTGAVACLALDAHLSIHGVRDHDGRLELPPTLGNLYPPVVSPGGRWLAVQSNDRVVNVYDLEEGRRVAAPCGSLPPTAGPSFDPGERWVSVGALILDLREGGPARRLAVAAEGGPERTVSASAWLADRSLLLALAPSGNEPGSQLARLPGSAVEDVLAAGDDRRDPPWQRIDIGRARVEQLLTVPGDAPDVLVLDETGTLTRRSGPDLAPLWTTEVAPGSIRMALPGRPGSRLCVASNDGWIRVVDLATGELLPDRAWKAAEGITRRAALNSIAAGPESGMVTTCTVDGRVQTWSATDGRRMGTLSTGQSFLRHVGTVPGAPWVVAAGGLGRLVLLGEGTPPVQDAALEAWGGPGYTLEARLADVEAWWPPAPAKDRDLADRVSVTAEGLARALERTYRYRRSDWVDGWRTRLRSFGSR